MQTRSSEQIPDTSKSAGKKKGKDKDKDSKMPEIANNNAAAASQNAQVRPHSRDAGSDRQMPPIDKVKGKSKKGSSHLQPVDIVRRLLLKRIHGLESLGRTHLSQDNEPRAVEESKTPNHDLFEDSRDIDVSLDDVVYADQGLTPPKESQGVNEPQTDSADMWYQPLDLSMFATSNILAVTQSGSLKSADPIGFGSLSLWTENFARQGISVEDAPVVDFEKEQHRAERLERKHARAEKREKRRAERAYRLGNLEDDVLRVRADFMRSFRGQ
jgi:hypothetical protein